jgi:UDP-N-acetylglucosamine--N-acetylmuramyl-(pentapeptide) pyrophosphoryl-undecaprenol N-acetylglucosamine transferase
MKILLTGGGTGGHFYPLIAVAEKINKLADEQRVVDTKLYYMSDTPYDKAALFENGITFVEASSGKNRLYGSSKNITDLFKVAMGCISATFTLFGMYPDVVFSKGGYASVPALFAARLLRIPVIIHDSDSVPGRVSLWSAKFALRIAISYPEAIEYFPKDKTALTGQPIREAIAKKANEGAHEYWKFDPTIPTVFVVGGSLGAQTINNTLIDILPVLLNTCQVIHQVGPTNMTDAQERVSVVLDKHQYKDRYKLIGFMNPLMVKMAAGAANVIVSRAGSMIFEIANWGIPSIIIPIPETISRDQKHNAYNYARSGACDIIEENNLTPSILGAEITKLLENPTRIKAMQDSALKFAHADAAENIAKEIIRVALTHEA